MTDEERQEALRKRIAEIKKQRESGVTQNPQTDEDEPVMLKMRGKRSQNANVRHSTVDMSFSLGQSDEANNGCTIERDSYKEFVTVLGMDEVPALLMGETGAGKTYMVAQAAKELAEKMGFEGFVRIPFDDTFSTRDLKGEWTLVKKDGVSQTEFMYGVLTTSIQRPVLILLDDMSGMSSNKMFMLHQLLDSRKLDVETLGTVEMHPNCRIVGALNPHTGKYSGTNKLDSSLVNRFKTIDIPQFNRDELNRIIPNSEHKGNLIEFYVKTQEAIRTNHLDFEISVRNIAYITRLLQHDFSIKRALDIGFLNGARLTSDEDQVNTAVNVAIGVFGKAIIESEKKHNEQQTEANS